MKMGVDPFELRYKNIYRPGDTTPTGQTPEVFSLPEIFDKLRPLYEEAKERAKKESTPEKKKGVGICLGIYGCGLDGPDSSEVGVELTPEGVSLTSCWEDHGQGADMGALGTCHEALRPLGIRPDQIKLVMNDTANRSQQRSIGRKPSAGDDGQRHQEWVRNAPQRHAKT